jgi:polysaccharide export outer membrane protein
MRNIQPALVPFAVLIVGAVLVGNWRAHRETQRKLDVLATAFDAKPAESTVHTPATSTPAEPKLLPPGLVVPAAGSVGRESEKLSPPAHLIEPPDVLVIEALLRDPRTRQTERLPVQPISGEFLVRPDGTVGLGVWGSVTVTGLTPDKAADAIRRKLAAFTQVNGTDAKTESLAVTVEVKAANSKACYVITDFGNGETVTRLPLTGTETVLDAIATIPGLAAQADRRSICVVRQSPTGGSPSVLPVDWNAIMFRGDARTNYALYPGDRVQVSGNR